VPTLLAVPVIAASADTAPVPSTPTAGAVATYTLITGDRVSVTSAPDGRPVVRLVGGGDAAAFQVLTSGSHLYVIPEDAAGYIGQPLALDLFDVTTLEPSSASQPTLAVYYAAGTAPVLPPGLTRQTGHAVSVTDPVAFGHALRAARLDQQAGRPDNLFAGITAIRPALAAAATPPLGALYTVRVKAFDRRGQRVGGAAVVAANADDVNRYLAAQSFFRGELAFSVPAGHYSFSTYLATVEPGNTVDWTLAAAPDVTITRDTTVVLDARKATQVTAGTPRASTATVEELNYQRNSAAGLSFTASFTTFGPDPLYATPTPAVATGELYFYPYFRLVDPDSVPSGYVYDVESAYAGAIPDDLTHTYGPNELATEQATYHSPVPGRSEYEERDGFTTWQAVSVGASSVLAAPGSRTEYVTARPDLLWLHSIATDADSFGGVTTDGLRLYAPGEQRAVDWLGQPMAAGIEQEPSVGQICPVCRSGDTLSTQLFPYTDSAGQFQLPDSTVTEDLALYDGNQQLGDSPHGFASFPLSADPATYRLVYDVSRDAPWWPTSTSVHTEWRFPSAERAPDPLPVGWSCAGKGGGGGRGGGGSGGGGDGCSFEPLLFTRFTTSAGADDVIPAGSTATVDVTVFHQHAAPAAPVTTFSAEVSFDGGASWQQVPATAQGEGQYQLSYPQPALADTDGFAALRIHAGDDSGSLVDQTILRAYPLAVTAPAQLPGQPGSRSSLACPAAVAAPFVQCQAVVDTAAGVSLDAPHGLGPDDLASAYRLPSSGGAGKTVAIVDAYDDPNAEADLAAYRAEYGLAACTSATGCFRKVGQGGSPDELPTPDPGWGLEISLDLDAVSATCPACHILLVEGNSPSLADLIPAVDTAARLGADVISNSYSSRGEFSGEQTLERYYRNLKVPFVVATGDYGYGNGAILIGGVGYPSASRYAIAVGGTSLIRDDSARGWTETAWDGATSGCSAYIHKPGWQQDKLCGMRTVADISAVADPKTGLAVYDTFGYDGWLQVGGTSLATPVISAAYAMGPAPRLPYASGLYQAHSGLFDVVGGSNGDCQNTYLCTAVPGYDGPTGLGSPDGTGAL
jgi:hypothetical protein